VEAIDSRPVQSLLCLEFKIGQDPLDSLAALRKVNSATYNSAFVFKLKGIVHGKSLTNQQSSFEVQLRGEDIVNGLMERIHVIRDKMS